MVLPKPGKDVSTRVQAWRLASLAVNVNVRNRFISPFDRILVSGCARQAQQTPSFARMHTSMRTQLHCGCVNIGHAHGLLKTRAVSQHTYRRHCKVPERFPAAFLGRSLEHNVLSTCSRRQGRPARSTVQTSAIFGFLRGDAGEQTRKKYQAQVDAINRLEPEMQSLSDEQLAAKTQDLRSRAQKKGNVDDLLVEAFAVSSHCFAFPPVEPCKD